MKIKMKNLREEAHRKLNEHLRSELTRLRSTFARAAKYWIIYICYYFFKKWTNSDGLNFSWFFLFLNLFLLIPIIKLGLKFKLYIYKYIYKFLLKLKIPIKIK